MNRFKPISATCICIVTSALILTSCGGGGSGGANDSIPSLNWGVAELLETDNASTAITPQISINAAGTAFAVWKQSDSIITRKYTPDIGWGTIELISSGVSASPQIAVDSQGNAVAVWQKKRTRTRNGITITEFNIMASSYTSVSGWGTEQLIETSGDDAFRPQVAIDSDGTALVVWHQFTGDRSDIWANRYIVGNGWDAATLIETNNIGSAYRPEISMNVNGDAFAVWQQIDNGGNVKIWGNRYLKSGDFGTAELINQDNLGSASSPQVTVNAEGNAFAIWTQNLATEAGSESNIWANRYIVGSGWGNAELISKSSTKAFDPKIVSDTAGNYIAMWHQIEAGQSRIVFNRYFLGGGWGVAAIINTPAVSDSIIVQVAINAFGNAMIVWTQEDGINFPGIWASRLGSNGWGAAKMIDTANVGSSTSPRIAVDAFGNAHAVWQQYDGTRFNIWTNRFE